MPSTYSTSLKLELIGNGEQTGTWGQTTNNNLGTLIEQAITGVGQLSLSGDYVLTNYNGLPDDARNAVLVFSGSLAAPANVVAPSVQKTYIVTNNAGANVTLKTASGTGVVIGNGISSLVYCDGTEFYTAVNVNNIVGDLSVSGNITAGGSLNLGNCSISGAAGNLTITANTSIVDMSTNTGAFVPPTGTLAQRPSSPTIGMSRWNSTNGVYEIWNGVNWQIIASGSYSADYLIVAGGGGGGAAQNTYTGNGGGGAGGLLTTLGGAQISLTPGTTYSIAVGAGGASGAKGANSSITGQTVAIGGGYGGSTGGSGGSGGAASGSGTAGQGYAGGGGGTSSDDGNTQSYSGGGGAGAVGNNASGGGASAAYPGAGGIGLTNNITGSSAYYAGGGGGGSRGTPGASGGNGGGGAGGGSETSGTAGTANTGGGGGGSGSGAGGQLGGAGGSGVVILSVPTTNYSGVTSGSPTVTTNGSYTVMKFTSSGSYTA